MASSWAISDRNKRYTTVPTLLCRCRLHHVLIEPASLLTRLAEAVWGADPLEYIGGFRNLSFDAAATFRSSLTFNGTAKWNLTDSTRTTVSSTSANTAFCLSYSNVDWDLLRSVYGWAAVQYQAWVRGEIVITGKKPQHVILHTDAVLEYWLDDEHYFGGDFYSFRKAPPVFHLKPGVHKIELRVVRDVRAFGGISEPIIEVVVGIQQASGRLELSEPGLLIADVVDGKLATSVASVSLRNSGKDDIEIIKIKPLHARSLVPPTCLNRAQPKEITENKAYPARTSSTPHDDYYSFNTIIVAGQTRAVAFNISLSTTDISTVNYTVVYKHIASDRQFTLHVSQQLRHVSIYQPHRITFLHPGGQASYAMLRPPAKNASCHSYQRRLPVLLALHGAGLEADNPMVTGALDPVSDLCVWVLFPTGVTPWSGDDWHSWGFSDVQAAIETVPRWIEMNDWKGSGVDIDRWIVIGHSNGGQGTWYALTHHPEKILAAAPVSGYASIQKYVSYELWQPADPRRTAIISGSLNSYRHEMLMPNVEGIPIQQQHGEIDDNVPAYNSRFLFQQIHLVGSTSNYSEKMGQNHWWEGVMTTSELVDFYHKQAKNEDFLPRKLKEFSFLVGDPGDMGSKSGITVTALEDPGQYGKVDVKGHTVTTSNVLSLDFDSLLWNTPVLLNGQLLDFSKTSFPSGSSFSAYASGDTWAIRAFDTGSKGFCRRRGQMGSMNAILRTRGPLIIRHTGCANISRLALQVSRNLYQYFKANALIVSSASYQLSSNRSGNFITLGIGSSIDNPQHDFPIRVDSSGISVRNHKGHDIHYGDEARGAAFLRPLDEERLDLVLWGADYEGLQQAARMSPSLTGVGQPDFVVFGKSAKWRGIEGAIALGFFDSNWNITASSVVESR